MGLADDDEDAIWSVVIAARVAHANHMDIVAVLDEKDPHKRSLRLAAAIVISTEHPPAMCPWLAREE